LDQFCFNWIIETPGFPRKAAGCSRLPAAYGRSAQGLSQPGRSLPALLARHNISNLLFLLTIKKGLHPGTDLVGI
jgi:hypothetical protein